MYVQVLSLLLTITRDLHRLKNRKNKRKKEERKTTQMATKKTRDLHAEENGRTGIRRKKKKNDKFRCLWIKVPYPVTEDCTCSCRKIEE